MHPEYVHHKLWIYGNPSIDDLTQESAGDINVQCGIWLSLSESSGGTVTTCQPHLQMIQRR